jgi:hypothetical protein
MTTHVERFVAMNKDKFLKHGVACELQCDGMTLVLTSGDYALESFWIGNSVAVGRTPLFFAACQKRLIREVVLCIFSLCILENANN